MKITALMPQVLSSIWRGSGLIKWGRAQLGLCVHVRSCFFDIVGAALTYRHVPSSAEYNLDFDGMFSAALFLARSGHLQRAFGIH